MKQMLDPAIQDYLAFRRSMDLRPATIRNEHLTLRRLLLANGNVYVDKLDDRHVTRFFEDAGKTRSANSLQLDYQVLGQFFGWARKTKRMSPDSDPMYGRRRPRRTHRERGRVSVAQFPALLEAAGENDPRDRAAVALLIYTLCRDSEITSLRVGDLDLQAGYLHVRITKSRTEDRLPVCSELDQEMRDWLEHYATAIGRNLLSEDVLIPRRHSTGVLKNQQGRISGHDMTYVPAKPLVRARDVLRPALIGIGYPVEDSHGNTLFEGSHTIRRSGARALFDRLAADGYDHSLRIVQSMLHHANVAQTEHYIGVTADRRSRDEILRGKPMYQTDKSNVLRMAR